MLPTQEMIQLKLLRDMNGEDQINQEGNEVDMQIQMVRIRGIQILIIRMVLILIGIITMG
jgi:hypothetical protein